MEAIIPWTAENIETHVLKFTRAPDSTGSLICAANYGPYPHHLALCDATIPYTEPKEVVKEILSKLQPGHLDDIIPVFRRLALLVLCERHNHPFERYLTRCRWTWNLAQINWSVTEASPSTLPDLHVQKEGYEQHSDEERRNEDAKEVSIDDEAADWESWESEFSTSGQRERRLRTWEDDLWKWQEELQTRERSIKKRERALVRKENEREREERLRVLEGALGSWAGSLRRREESLKRKLFLEILLEMQRSRVLTPDPGGVGLEGWLLPLEPGWLYWIVTLFLTVGICLTWKHP
ncbi:hypothetical protein V8F20_011280 [Naviculisporaceae sp. PSN 640]